MIPAFYIINISYPKVKRHILNRLIDELFQSIETMSSVRLERFYTTDVLIYHADPSRYIQSLLEEGGIYEEKLENLDIIDRHYVAEREHFDIIITTDFPVYDSRRNETLGIYRPLISENRINPTVIWKGLVFTAKKIDLQHTDVFKPLFFHYLMHLFGLVSSYAENHESSNHCREIYCVMNKEWHVPSSENLKEKIKALQSHSPYMLCEYCTQELKNNISSLEKFYT